MADQHLARAQSLFEQEKFAESRDEAQKGIDSAAENEAATVRTLKLLVRKCATHLPAEASASAAVAPAAAGAAPTPTPAAAPAAPLKPQTSCRYEWFQTPANVTFSFYVKGRTQEQVKVDTEKRNIEVTIQLDEGKEFQLSHDPLFAEIDPAKTEVHVKQPKVEVVLHKVIQGLHWSAIELSGPAAAQITTAAPPVAALPQTQKQLAYPNSKGRDWSTFNAEEEEGDKSKLSGDEGLNKLFRDIYSNATDENRKAMVKSFTESGGTVLSTNWTDVGARRVDGEAPKGMEMKKYEQ
jgi:suppressor of G2 allele of SKP1